MRASFERPEVWGCIKVYKNGNGILVFIVSCRVRDVSVMSVFSGAPLGILLAIPLYTVGELDTGATKAV